MIVLHATFFTLVMKNALRWILESVRYHIKQNRYFIYGREQNMSEHNRKESAKLARPAKWVIRQLLSEIESRGTEIELYDAVEGGYAVYYRLLSGDESVVTEFAGKLNIRQQENRLEVPHE